jgi:hypothetical protein
LRSDEQITADRDNSILNTFLDISIKIGFISSIIVTAEHLSLGLPGSALRRGSYPFLFMVLSGLVRYIRLITNEHMEARKWPWLAREAVTQIKRHSVLILIFGVQFVIIEEGIFLSPARFEIYPP